MVDEDWTHDNCVRLAYLYLRDHGLRGALRRLRLGIERGTSTARFQERDVVAWLAAIASRMQSGAARETSTAFLRDSPELADPRYLITGQRFGASRFAARAAG